VLVLEQHAGMLESALLAGCLDVEQHIRGREDGSETVHTAAVPFRSYNAPPMQALTTGNVQMGERRL
jgi:hypothetical protein